MDDVTCVVTLYFTPLPDNFNFKWYRRLWAWSLSGIVTSLVNTLRPTKKKLAESTVRKNLHFIVLIWEDQERQTGFRWQNKGSTFLSVILRPHVPVRARIKPGPTAPTVPKSGTYPTKRDSQWTGSLVGGCISQCMIYRYDHFHVHLHSWIHPPTP